MRSDKWFYISLMLAFLLVAYAGAGFSMRVTDSPPFCGSCHVMNEAVRTHQKSVHAKVACNQCHAPQDDFFAKAMFKTRSGMRDIYMNTLGTIPHSIEAGSDTKGVVNQNCVQCHQMTVINVSMDAKTYCTDCHRQIPHFKKTPIDQRKVAHE